MGEGWRPSNRERDLRIRRRDWRELKGGVIAERGPFCERCGDDPNDSDLQLHHRSYVHWLYEGPEDVELLCNRCHAIEHRRDYFAPRYHELLNGWWRRDAENDG
jgi:5-methylcytosine-specific restriction endonuclease McrA